MKVHKNNKSEMSGIYPYLRELGVRKNPGFSMDKLLSEDLVTVASVGSITR